MPVIYRIRCSRCDADHTYAGQFLAYLHPDGSEEQLGHPGEDFQLAQYGLTMETAPLKLYAAYVCRRCGDVAYRAAANRRPVDWGGPHVCEHCANPLTRASTDLAPFRCRACGAQTATVNWWGIS